MPEHGKPDRWNSLLEDLGVPVSESKPPEPAPEAAESAAAPPAAKSQQVSMLRPEKPKAAPKPKPATPAKSPSYWSRIAGALGLEVAAEPQPPAPEPPPAGAEAPTPARAEESHREPPQREPQQQGPRRAPESTREAEIPPREFGRSARAERPDRESRPSREERLPREDRSPREERQHRDRPGSSERPRFGEPAPRSSLDDMFGAKPADLDVFGLAGEEAETPRVREPRGDSSRGKSDDSGPVIDYDVPEGSGSDLSLDPAEAREFGAPREESGERDGQRRRRRRRGRGRRGSGAESREDAPPRHEADIEPAGEDADFDIDRDAELDLDTDQTLERGAPPERHERGQRRDRGDESDRYPPSTARPSRDEDDDRGGRPRRRRGGRDRGESAGPRPAAYGPSSEESPRFAPPRDQRPATAKDADDDLDDDLSSEIDDAELGPGGDLPTHRKIPTWDEAVGILINANMANRGPDRDRDRGRSRGRGRGR